MRHIYSFVLVMIAMLGQGIGVAFADIGTIQKSSGEASIVRGNETLAAKTKVKLEAGDRVLTGSNGQLFLRMIDNSKMIIRPNSEVFLESLTYKKKPSDEQKTSVLSGAIRAVSGAVGKQAKENVSFSAGTATIGIRGTDIEIAIIGDGASDRAGIYNYVYDGETEMALKTGERAVVEKEKAGFTPKDPKPGEALLQVLDDRPAFLSGSGFDTLIQQLTNPRIPSIR